MTMHNEMNEKEERFLIQLYQRTKGNLSAQVSLYEIGAELELNREQSSRAAETLMAFGFAEIRTLSGGISISGDGVKEAEKHVNASDRGTAPKLGNKAVIDENGREAVNTVLTNLKTMVPEMGLAFELLEELMADMKTVAAQMISPRPKTAIVRECFVSLANMLEKTKKSQGHKMVKDFLAD
ncbi:MAG: hypothetical protein R2941_17550 [Desulfobacterales bacterium]